MSSVQHPVLTPALEGSREIVPMTARLPVRGRYDSRPYPYSSDFGGNSEMYRGYYPTLPPIGSGSFANVRPSNHYSVPSLMGRYRGSPYMGPPFTMPYWGGYSTMGQYYPGHPNQFMGPRNSGVKVIPVPIRVPRKIPPPPPQPVVYERPIPPRKTNVDNRPNSMFLFGIILKEIVAALHRIYLNPNGNIYPVLNDIIGPNCYDLSALVHGGKLGEREESVLIQELQYVIENLVYHITEIMPSTGVLGTHRKSAVFELIKSGKRFPDGYFWQVELDRLQMSEGGRTANVGDAEGFMLLLGIFISRSLVTTILMKPVDYGLSSQPITEVAERNLRVVASALLYLVRRITVSKGRGIMEMPEEIAKYLYTDEEMQHVYSRLSRTFNYAEGLLREWGTEYIRRLRSSSVQS